jgi:c-di-GMP-binding flagellar brake protein YcgR
MAGDTHQEKPKQADAGIWEKKRHHPRKSFRLCVTMSHDRTTGKHQARDISLGGIFVETTEKLQPGQEVRLSIPFTNQDCHLKMNGKVVRVTEDGVGVQFDIYAIDIE